MVKIPLSSLAFSLLSVHMWVRGQPMRVGPLLPPCGARGLSSGQAGQQAPLPPEASHQPALPALLRQGAAVVGWLALSSSASCCSFLCGMIGV